jgi:glucose-6-phosphate isomerase
LGLEAVHAVLDEGKVELSVLDAISAHSLDLLLQKLLALKSIKNVAICVVSKSGKTTETLANAAVLLETLQSKFGEAVYAQTVFIGDTGSPLQKYAKLKSSLVYCHAK